MYKNIVDFIVDWEIEKELTLKMFSNITEDVKSLHVNENIRSLERLAWHITETLMEMPSKAGLLDCDFKEDDLIPGSILEIIDTYKKYSFLFVDVLQKNWNGADLEEEIEIYGQKWKKSKLLSVLINHQIHHRAQMTIIMRFYGMKVPGIYGPSKEEWIKYKMEAKL